MKNYNYPEKVQTERASLIREVAERGANIPGFITFALGSPAAECIPKEAITSAAAKVFSEDPLSVMAYGPLDGDPELRNWCVEYMKNRRNCSSDGQKILMLTGSGKGLALVPRTLCEPGDAVFCEEISYPNATNCIRFAGANPVGIPCDEKGMIPAELKKAISKYNGKYIYLIPTFQNPTGRTMPLERRKEIYEIAKENGLFIYEDDPYGDIRFSGESVSSFKSFDEDDIVIFAGSFSKIMSSGLRVGFLFGPEEVISKIAMVKSGDGQDPIDNQKIIMAALNDIDFDAHIENLKKVYGEKCRLLADALKENCPSDYMINVPEGGMFLWIDVPDHVDVDKLSAAIIDAGAGVVKSAAFAVNEDNPGHGMRLNFSALQEESILKGAEIIGKVMTGFHSELKEF